MFDILLHFDETLFLLLNGFHGSAADFFFYWVSNRFIWIPLYAAIVFFLIKKWKKKTIPVIIALIVCVALSDQTCNLVKKTVQRPRPSHDTELCEQVHLVRQSDGTLYKGGPFSFPSSHAANATVLAVFTVFFCGNRKKRLISCACLWVFLLSYSRIYLGVHYPSDLFVGWCIGSIYAIPVSAMIKKRLQTQRP